MHLPDQKKIILLLVVFVFLFVKTSLAQYPITGASISSSNQQINTKAGLNASDRLYNNKYTFEITLADNSVKDVDSKIYLDTPAHKTYLLWIDKNYPRTDSANRYKKIYANKTHSIFRITFSQDTIRGLATDSCWMFKVITGPICVYSFLSEMDNGTFFDPLSIVGIQFKGGPIVKYNEDNLKQMIGGDNYALESLRQKNYIRAIKRFNWEKKKKN
jgi:hypothetical protein